MMADVRAQFNIKVYTQLQLIASSYYYLLYREAQPDGSHSQNGDKWKYSITIE